MTLVVARCIQNEPHVFADTLLDTSSDSRREARSRAHGLKMFLLEHDVCIAFAGLVEIANLSISKLYIDYEKIEISVPCCNQLVRRGRIPIIALT